MRPDLIVVLDACVLAPFPVCDLFLRLAEEPRLYSPRWSDEILDEVRRTQVAKLGWPERLADYWRQEVTAAFPEALVTGYGPLIQQCRNREEDRHVLAAAIKAPAHAIVTFNRKHFPPREIEPFPIVVHHPADYLCALYDMDPGVVTSRIHEIAMKRKLEPVEVLRRLGQPLGRFADHLAAQQGWTL